MIKVGYQGTKNSFSEIAALQLMKERGLKEQDYTLIPLVSSANVAHSLKIGAIDFGVVALSNNNGGIVEETNDIFLHDNWINVHKCVVPINQCVFVKNSAVEASGIRKVASHVQALRQCQETLQRLFGNFEAIRSDDTARAAVLLAEGAHGNDTAVVCSELAGLACGLHMLVKSAQDKANNNTEFGLIKKSAEKVTRGSARLRWFYHAFMTEQAFSTLLKISAGLLFLGSYPLHYINNHYLPENFSLTLQESMTYMVGVVITFILVLFQLRKKLQANMIAGYWLYSDKVQRGLEEQQLNHGILRAVIIDTTGGSFRVRGWLAKVPPEQYFESKAVFHSDLFAMNGAFIYKYSHYLNSEDSPMNGLVELEWNRDGNGTRITNLYGRYFGFQSRSTGSLNFQRVSRARFLEVCPIALAD